MLKRLSQNARVALLGGAGTVAAFFLFGGARDGAFFSAAKAAPDDAVPRDSFLVASADLADLRRSPLYELVLGKDPASPRRPGETAAPLFDPRALGMNKLADACGFDPLARVERLALAVPEEGDKGELGVAARVNVTTDELSRCTTALADRRGGKVETKEIGTYAVVEVAGEGAARPRIGYGRGGLLVAGRGTWFDTMVAASDGRAPGLRAAPAHVAMRTSLTSKDGWATPTLLVSALLPRSLRDRIKTEMGAEVGSKDNSQAMMGGVLGVSVVGLAVKAGGSGKNLEIAAELLCDDESPPRGDGEASGDAACALVEKLILKKRFDWSKELTLRMVGFGPLLDSIDVERSDKRLRVTAAAPADALAMAIERVLRFRARQHEPADPPPHVPSGALGGGTSGTAPDEVIPAPRAPASGAPVPSH